MTWYESAYRKLSKTPGIAVPVAFGVYEGGATLLKICGAPIDGKYIWGPLVAAAFGSAVVAGAIYVSKGLKDFYNENKKP